MVIYGKTLEIKDVTEGYTKEQVEQNIEKFTDEEIVEILGEMI